MYPNNLVWKTAGDPGDVVVRELLTGGLNGLEMSVDTTWGPWPASFCGRHMFVVLFAISICQKYKVLAVCDLPTPEYGNVTASATPDIATPKVDMAVQGMQWVLREQGLIEVLQGARNSAPMRCVNRGY